MLQRLILVLVLVLSIEANAQSDNRNKGNADSTSQKTFLFVHGAWGGGWEYGKVDSILTAQGHKVFRPTLTGLGEKVHLATQEIDLDTHIEDITNMVKFENLQNIILIGHSYGGLVIAGVANKIPEKISKMIFLDAFVPGDGESVKDVVGDLEWQNFIAPNIQDGFVQYPMGPVQEAFPKDVLQPLKTFTQKVSLDHQKTLQIPKYFILMNDKGKTTFNTWGRERAKKKDYKIFEMQGDHYPMRNQPENLADFIIKTVVN